MGRKKAWGEYKILSLKAKWWFLIGILLFFLFLSVVLTDRSLPGTFDEKLIKPSNTCPDLNELDCESVGLQEVTKTDTKGCLINMCE